MLKLNSMGIDIINKSLLIIISINGLIYDIKVSDKGAVFCEKVLN